MSNLDCLFVHVPSIRQGLSMPSACELVITISAMGLVSMSNELTKHGYSSEIVNLGLEKVLDWTFSLSEYVKL
ncbi:hypothetical protein IJV79_00890, partial [bacterium]|nr:hypothetical protein [bacterium]